MLIWVFLFPLFVVNLMITELRWPFDGSITVQAYNRTTEQWSNEHTITMNKDICNKHVERCVDILARGNWGHSK